MNTARRRTLPVWLILSLASFAPGSTTLPLAPPPDPQPVVEYWIGRIYVPNPACGELTFVVVLTRSGEQWSGRFSIAPGCGVLGMFDTPLEQVSRAPDAISFVTPVDSMRNSYTLRLDPDGATASGQLLINGMQHVAIRASRATQAEAEHVAPKRPQVPREPLPYESRPVMVATSGPSGTLAGVLSIPPADSGAPPLPAVVLLADDEPVDTDHTEGTHKPGLVLADLLARRGCIVLRLASPGIAGGGGSYLESTIADAAADAAGVAAFLTTVDRVDPRRIGFIGRGEGAMVAAAAAASRDDIAFVVLMAPAAAPWRDVLLLRERRQLDAQGEDPAYITARLERFGRILSLAARADAPGDLASALRADFEAQRDSGRAMALLNDFQQRDLVQVQSDFYTTPRVASRLREDPRPHLQKLRIPTLLLAAERDLFVPVADTLPAVEATLKAAGNTRVSRHVFPATNHWFQPCTTGFPDERGMIEITIAPPVADTIADWIDSLK